MLSPSIFMPELLWVDLQNSLRIRGNGCRESGAFLLGKPGSSLITCYACYDDLDQTCLDEGYIFFKSSGYLRLWEACSKRDVRVIADVHTHPRAWVQQSISDQTHPMIAQAGHFALIIPHYSMHPRSSLVGIGIFEYLGNHKWKVCNSDSGRVCLVK